MKFSRRFLLAFIPYSILTLAISGSAWAQSTCSPTSPAPISGSTGVLGVLDPTNTTVTDPSQTNGLAWPPGTTLAFIAMDTGLVSFYN